MMEGNISYARFARVVLVWLQKRQEENTTETKITTYTYFFIANRSAIVIRADWALTLCSVNSEGREILTLQFIYWHISMFLFNVQ